MVVKPTLTFGSGKKIVYGTPPASKSATAGATQQRRRSVPALFTQYGSICQELCEDAITK